VLGVNVGQASSRTPAAEGEAEARDLRAHRPRPGWVGLTVVVVLMLGAAGAYAWWRHTAMWVTTDNAYVAGHIHQVSARVTGTVQEVLVDDHQAVKEGDLLARLDPRDYEVKLSQAEAQVAQARAQGLQAAAQVAQAEAEISRREAQAGKARRDLERARALAPGSAGVISRQELDAVQTEADGSEAALRAARSALVAAQANATAAAAQEQAALANRQEAALQLSYTEIRAPATGKVGKKNLEVGHRVQPGQALLALVQARVWVTANLKETQLARLKAGQAAVVQVDAFPGRPVSGTVESVSSASGSQFALLPPDNATGNFTRIVQRVPVKVRLDAAELESNGLVLVPGMSTQVKIRVRS
jgi:membrane fusion protein (multidrug efflux system)